MLFILSSFACVESSDMEKRLHQARASKTAPSLSQDGYGRQDLTDGTWPRSVVLVEMCTPSKRHAHIGQKRVPVERESRGMAEFTKNIKNPRF
jgi:hypothetical protein